MSPVRVALAAFLVSSAPCAAQTTDAFEWPQADANALPDARLTGTIADAKQAAREGADRAWQAHKMVLQANVRSSLRGAIGLGGRPTTIAAGTVMRAVPYNNESGPMLGSVTYPNGASMTGLFGPDIGIYRASFTSNLSEFVGWCYGATSSNPIPTTGEYRFRSGDRFVGTREFETYQGIYESADHSRKFIGTMSLNSAAPRPVQGIMEDGHGHLLATVGSTG